MMSTSGLKATRASRVSPARAAAIYAAVIDLVREVGYEALTMDAIAARARCGKATLYRQWQSKPHLVASALRADSAVSLESIDTGSLRGDLHEMVRQVAEQAAPVTEVLAGLAHAIGRDQELHRALFDVIVTAENARIEVILARGVACGEIPELSPAAAFLPHLVIGALTARPVVEGRVVDRAFLDAFVDAVVLPALQSGGVATTRRSRQTRSSAR